jgi:hypothetical protein
MLDYDTASDLSEQDELDALYGMTFDGMPDEEDERYYCEFILSGLHDSLSEAFQDWLSDNYDPDMERETAYWESF